MATDWDDEEPSRETMIGRLCQHVGLLGLRAGQSLLEVGCGTGKTTGWLAEHVSPARVMAVDFSPEMIARAKAKGIDADFICVDVCEDDLGHGLYDVILCFHSFPHFRNQAAALQGLRRALKPDGRIIVMHLAGSRHINHFHAGVEGAVQDDMLPVGGQWPPLLAQVELKLVTHVDREDLFFLEAVAI